MKNKKLQYILFPLVIVIWGLIFLKIFNHIRGSREVHASYDYSMAGLKKDTVADTFSIVAHYRDPFYRAGYIQAKQQSAPGKSVIPQRVRQPVRKEADLSQVSWPEIVYGGVIYNEKDKSQTALLKIDNTDYLLKQGEETGGMRLVAVYSDSVKVTYMKETRTLNRILQSK